MPSLARRRGGYKVTSRLALYKSGPGEVVTHFELAVDSDSNFSNSGRVYCLPPKMNVVAFDLLPEI